MPNTTSLASGTDAAKFDSDRTGIFVAIVGPSGSGKDSIINWLSENLNAKNQIHFV